MIDSHVHLDHTAFEGDRDAVLARALEDGVTAVVNVGYDAASIDATEALVDAHAFVYGVVGIHPHDASTHTAALESRIGALLDRPRFLGVGEIGLDYYYDHSPRDVQRRVFERMLGVAKDRDKPVVIHCRDAFDDVVAILEAVSPRHRGIFHAFGGDAARLERVVGMGFHVGIGGVATFQRSSLAELVPAIPADRLVLETDAPYLTPHPFRGRRNEPGLVLHVARAVARHTGAPLQEIIARTTRNWRVALGVCDPSVVPPPLRLPGRCFIHVPGEKRAAPPPLDAVCRDDIDEVIFCGALDPLERPGWIAGAVAGVRARAARRGRIGRRPSGNGPPGGGPRTGSGIDVAVRTGIHGAAPEGAPGAVEDLAGLIDRLSVRFSGATAVQHERAAATGLGPAAFESLVALVRASVAAGIETELCFVAASKLKDGPCAALAGELGARFQVRRYPSLQ